MAAPAAVENAVIRVELEDGPNDVVTAIRREVRVQRPFGSPRAGFRRIRERYIPPEEAPK